MNTTILTPEVQKFIDENLKTDINKLIFKGSPFKDITVQELANQIIAKQKSEKKLPTWFNTKNIYYPAKLSIEQTSSEITANHKANLVKGDSVIDITGGLGIDCYAFSKHFKQVTHCEINEDLSKIVSHNYEQLKVVNVTTISSDGISYLENTNQKFDCIYIDPSRRNDIKGKVFLLKDCQPNVPKNLDFLFEKTDVIFIKNSPILDITATINELKYVKEIHVIALKNEVKELLFVLEKECKFLIEIKCTNLLKNKKEEFLFRKENVCNPSYDLPQNYLYEPNAAILKAGGFNEVSAQLNVNKLHLHSHLYTSENKLENFPGRTFKILNVFNYNKKNLKKNFSDKKANITIRNFPKTVAQIRKESKIKDGGDMYLFFTTNLNDEFITIVCSKS